MGAGGQNPQEKTVAELRAMREEQREARRIAQEQLEADRQIIAAHERFFAAMSHG
jgi:hypothetical protein